MQTNIEFSFSFHGTAEQAALVAILFGETEAEAIAHTDGTFAFEEEWFPDQGSIDNYHLMQSLAALAPDAAYMMEYYDDNGGYREVSINAELKHGQLLIKRTEVDWEAFDSSKYIDANDSDEDDYDEDALEEAREAYMSECEANERSDNYTVLELSMDPDVFRESVNVLGTAEQNSIFEALIRLLITDASLSATAVLEKLCNA